MQQEKNSGAPSSAFGRIWMKVPLVVRSILTGFVVTSIGVGIWVLLVKNIPEPWSVVPMGAILIPYWIYFSGRWNPSRTRAFSDSLVKAVCADQAEKIRMDLGVAGCPDHSPGCQLCRDFDVSHLRVSTRNI